MTKRRLTPATIFTYLFDQYIVYVGNKRSNEKLASQEMLDYQMLKSATGVKTKKNAFQKRDTYWFLPGKFRIDQFQQIGKCICQTSTAAVESVYDGFKRTEAKEGLERCSLARTLKMRVNIRTTL